MIALGQDFLVFRLASGESLPLSANMVSADLVPTAEKHLDSEFVDEAASAVFPYGLVLKIFHHYKCVSPIFWRNSKQTAQR